MYNACADSNGAAIFALGVLTAPSSCVCCFLFSVVFSALVLKTRKEKPVRPVRSDPESVFIWEMDGGEEEFMSGKSALLPG